MLKQDFLVTTSAPLQGCLVLFPITQRADALLNADYDQPEVADLAAAAVLYHTKLAYTYIDEAREKGMDVAVLDWTPEITALNAKYMRAEIALEGARDQLESFLMPQIEAAIDAKDAAKINLLLWQLPSPSGRAGVMDMARQAGIDLK